MSFDLTELRDVFFDEAYEHLGTLETALLALEQQPGNRELLNQIFRAAHSIKGGSGTFGFTDLLRFTHALEGLLHLVRDGVIAFAPPLPGSPSPDTTDALLAEIERAMPRTYEPAPADATVDAVASVPEDLPPSAPSSRSVRVLFVPAA